MLPDAPAHGYWQREELLVPPSLLADVEDRFALALYTGRNPGEADLAQLRLGLQIDGELCWVADGRPRKPDPTGLLFLCEKLVGASSKLAPAGGATPRAEALFVGDTADDAAAARAAQAAGAPLRYAHVEAPGDTARALEQLLRERGMR